jgi:hypothetical protein
VCIHLSWKLKKIIGGKLMENKETTSLVESIRKAGKAERIAEFKCPYIADFFVKVAYASKFVLNQIREASTETSTNVRTREPEERLNDEKLRDEYSRRIIHGWRGLTPEKLEKILPGLELEGIEPDEEIPFSQEIALAILEVSLEFEDWVVSTAITVENFTKKLKENQKDLENLK